MKMKIFFMSVVLAGFVAAGFVSRGLAEESTLGHPAKKAVYYCPMHPHYVSDKKGTCPICGMDLVKKETAEEPAASGGVAINENKQQLIGVKKDIVKKRPLAVEILTSGKVAYDPDLYVAEEEYIQALKTAAATEKSALVSIREQSQGLLASAERKLALLGMSKTEIETLKNSGVAQDNLYLSGNSGKAWIYVTIYEYEMGLVKEGQEVFVDAVAFPGEVFKGKVKSLTPILNSESRSVHARSEVDDKDGKLKPEMFVNAKILVDLGEKLAVPEEAVMDSGTRKIVYVVTGDHFTLREVTLGSKAGEFYEVLSGLEEGEAVVTSGNFLIDAESKLKGSL
ncbi:MAG: efflux RND transporter periplasmic adaptor subunit [Candidatus Omnitrophica bacterium]|nr:efflux RND transporter periplasmic adaptor subunit [Candidatus Omnitrophota bacterium]